MNNTGSRLQRGAIIEQPIERRPLSAQLADRIRDMILTGDYPPGARLQEMEMSAQFGVSRTPLREALKTLSSEGLVTLAPNRGATVTELTDTELADTFPVMGALEGLAGELACANATDVEIDAITKLHTQMIKSYQGGDLASYYDINRQIHAAILAAAHNQTLAQSHGLLAGRVTRARFRGQMSDQRWAAAVGEHERILSALRARDGKKLAELLRQHVDTKYETVREGKQLT